MQARSGTNSLHQATTRLSPASPVGLSLSGMAQGLSAFWEVGQSVFRNDLIEFLNCIRAAAARYLFGNAPNLYPEDGNVLLLRLSCLFWGWVNLS
jgi:hypothetical protein